MIRLLAEAITLAAFMLALLGWWIVGEAMITPEPEYSRYVAPENFTPPRP